MWQKKAFSNPLIILRTLIHEYLLCLSKAEQMRKYFESFLFEFHVFLPRPAFSTTSCESQATRRKSQKLKMSRGGVRVKGVNLNSKRQWVNLNIITFVASFCVKVSRCSHPHASLIHSHPAPDDRETLAKKLCHAEHRVYFNL